MVKVAIQTDVQLLDILHHLILKIEGQVLAQAGPGHAARALMRHRGPGPRHCRGAPCSA